MLERSMSTVARTNTEPILAGKYFTAREATVDDASFIHQLRLNRGTLLHPTSADVAVQMRYMERAAALRQEGKEVYLLVRDLSGVEVGCFRITSLDDAEVLNYESLILTKDADRNIAVNVIMCVYQLAFEVWHRKSVGPFIVRHANDRVWRLHLAMGMVDEVSAESPLAKDYRVFQVKASGYQRTADKLKEMGFGMLSSAPELVRLGLQPSSQ